MSETTTSAPDIRTLEQLRASGHEQKTLRAELRDNLHRAISRMPTHAQFIENSCKAPEMGSLPIC